MKETWSAFRAVEAFLGGCEYMCFYTSFRGWKDSPLFVQDLCSQRKRKDMKSMRKGDLQPSPDVEITSRHLCRAKENVTAVTTRTSDLDAVLAAMSSG